ncbi:MAG: LTA synthase family protein [Desulfuromonadaceae bacterium]|nr:LTA synthase family protein [Desulfuromonadaceae bacterium]MDD2856010.1 LTA synthase family protein [Desulfuromonadaceae bacterium]
MQINNRFNSLYTLWLIILIFSTLSRTILLLVSLPQIGFDPVLIAKIYAVGLFFDFVTFSYFVIPFVLAAVILPDKIFNSSFFKYSSYGLCFILTYLMLFNVVAEYTFFEEFATRFNFIAIDYLIYTTEVVSNITESYPVYWILAGLFALNIFVFIAARNHLSPSFSYNSTFVKRLKVGVPILLIPLASFAAVDLSMTQISPNNYADELAGNGIYCLFAAFRNNELDFNKFYVNRDDKSVMARLKALVQEKNSSFVNDDSKTFTRVIKSNGAEKHLNVIMVIEESLSAAFLSLGLTPNIDDLAKKSLNFTHLYATGTRTVRGLEALTLSMPPLPGTSIVKRPNNENFASWGSVMKKKGYDNKFIYAGHGYFDNMNYFYANNGFATIDRTNFTDGEVTFTNAWGVCDEDLFLKTIKEADRSEAAKKPFFSVVMTTSNHRPYTYPEGKIDIPSHTSRAGGVKYADYAIGRFLEEAKKKPWFDNTIFIIVADHCAGSAAKLALPVKNYEIPLLVYAPALIKPQVVDRMMSQIDVAPTILGLLNFSYTSSFIGKDVMTSGDWTERAFISTYQKLGYIQNDKLLVLGPQKRADYYSFERVLGMTTVIKPDEGLLFDALAYIQGTNYIYKNRMNRLKN